MTVQIRTLAALLPVLLFSACRIHVENFSQEAVSATVLAKERESLDKWSAGDPVGFADNLDQEVTYFDDIGASTRLDGLEEVQAYLQSLVGKIGPHAYEIVDPKVQVAGEVAILTLQYHGALPDGQPLPPWKATSVYQLIDGDWRVVHAHWSLVKE